MNKTSIKTIFLLLSGKQIDSFELGAGFFSELSPEEKEKMKCLLNETSLYYFYKIVEGRIERTEHKSML